MSGTKVIEYLLKKEIFPAELGLRTLYISYIRISNDSKTFGILAYYQP
jgi:hypothetical protein